MSAGFSFAPKYWAACNGQILPVAQNQALFALLGTQYGGNGTSNFALPDLRGRAPIGAAPSAAPSWQPTIYAQGTALGSETVTLTSAQIPSHSHGMTATTAAARNGFPSATERFATSTPAIYGPAQNLVGLAGGPLAPAGDMAHANMQPYEVINMCIALSGIWPSRG
ncbi:MAG: tail fiber protein [Sphingopyxis sp.]|uniref:phage tail protein n=1 Tax=Sphingopyxis sp. TaxID=1908224 RepID=UPI002ABBADBD|nr:tail fiber protein [Sphingopyxis sp.]MDZ3832819.1 tail fiber protein [Sphingopyxis sp.]